MHTMRRSLFVGAAALAASLALPAHAHGFRVGELVIDHPYAMPSLAGTSNGAAYFRGIRNKGKAVDRLIGASTAVAGRVELHEMTMEGDVMKMRAVPAIELAPGQEVELRHGQRYHLMLLDLTQPLKEGDRFELTLKFERAGEAKVKVWVQQPKAREARGHSH